MNHAEDALTRQIELTAKYEGELEVLRQRLDLAERVIEVLREDNGFLERERVRLNEEITRLHALIDGAYT